MEHIYITPVGVWRQTPDGKSSLFTLDEFNSQRFSGGVPDDAVISVRAKVPWHTRLVCTDCGHRTTEDRCNKASSGELICPKCHDVGTMGPLYSEVYYLDQLDVFERDPGDWYWAVAGHYPSGPFNDPDDAREDAIASVSWVLDEPNGKPLDRNVSAAETAKSLAWLKARRASCVSCGWRPPVLGSQQCAACSKVTPSVVSPAPTSSPWGRPDRVRALLPGIWWISTPSHGGFYVAPERMVEIPELCRSTPYSARGYFEEDVDCLIVLRVFPGLDGAGPETAIEQQLRSAVRYFGLERLAALGIAMAAPAPIAPHTSSAAAVTR